MSRDLAGKFQVMSAKCTKVLSMCRGIPDLDTLFDKVGEDIQDRGIVLTFLTGPSCRGAE